MTRIELAFKNLKSDLSLRPIFHQKDPCIEAPILMAFPAFCLRVTLQERLRALPPGPTPRAVLEKFAVLQMVDLHLPTTDGRTLILPRYTQSEKDQLVVASAITAEPQPVPRITSRAQLVQ